MTENYEQVVRGSVLDFSSCHLLQDCMTMICDSRAFFCLTGKGWKEEKCKTSVMNKKNAGKS